MLEADNTTTLLQRSPDNSLYEREIGNTVTMVRNAEVKFNIQTVISE